MDKQYMKIFHLQNLFNFRNDAAAGFPFTKEFTFNSDKYNRWLLNNNLK